ncbi:hypothetical protein [Hydrogenophaga sp. 5NK40-0174]|uniref:hypothetical protein n=1 Tax=Hydrogenophaga sp. 5NK40-0174 TaxID=3127649 RepID=UPI00310C4791
MKRYKWFRISLPIDLQLLLDRLNSNPFLGDVDFGFGFVAGSGGRIRFRYYRRVKLVVGFVDERGDPANRLIDSIESFEFEFISSNGLLIIRIDDPPRSIKSLLDRLERACGEGFSVELMTFPFDCHQIILSGPKSTRLIALKGAGADRRRNYVARVEVASREGIVLEHLTVLRGLDFSIENSTYEVITNEGKGQVAFLASGVVRFSDQIADSLLVAFEGYLLDGNEHGRL